MSPEQSLSVLGWRVDTLAQATAAIRDFQAAWNLGAPLAVDGSAGPATRAALAVSVDRRAKGLPDISEHFNASEFACACGGRWADCRRIWTPRSTIAMAERYRVLIGPFTPERAGRCPTENARVGGASKSQHLYGRGLDVPVRALRVEELQAARIGATGIGYYTWRGARYVRHIDNRAGEVTPWSYGILTAPPAPLHRQPAVTTPPVPQEDDMPLTDADVNRIRDAILWAPTFPDQEGEGSLGGSSIRNNIGMAASAAVSVRALVAAQSPEKVAAAVKAAIAADDAPDVDVDALARAIVLELGKEAGQ